MFNQPISKINNYLEYWIHCIIDSIEKESGACMLNPRKSGISKKAFYHLRRIRRSSSISKRESFRKGYIDAANKISLTLAFLPHVDISIGKKLLTHLGYQLNHLTESLHRDQYSPTSAESSGYGSDNTDSG